MPYRAPELFDVPSNATIDERTDTFSLGATLYAMAAPRVDQRAPAHLSDCRGAGARRSWLRCGVPRAPLLQARALPARERALGTLGTARGSPHDAPKGGAGSAASEARAGGRRSGALFSPRLAHRRRRLLSARGKCGRISTQAFYYSPFECEFEGNHQRVVDCSHLRVIGGAQYPTEHQYSKERRLVGSTAGPV